MNMDVRYSEAMSCSPASANICITPWELMQSLDKTDGELTEPTEDKWTGYTGVDKVTAYWDRKDKWTGKTWAQVKLTNFTRI